MIIIGEKINSSLKAVRAAMENRESDFIKELAVKQNESGASYIDVNAGIFLDMEPEILEWAVGVIQDAVDLPISIDSPNPAAIERALKINKNGKPIINSITGQKDRFEAIMPLVKEYNTRIIALCMDDTGMPETVNERLKIADNLVNNLVAGGTVEDDIFIDPLVRPIGTGSHYGIAALDTIYNIKKEFPNCHIACGLSNISFGIPARKLMNQAFLVAAMTKGMDGAILDPTDLKLMSLLYATRALLGHDDFCMDYIMKFREGLLDS